MLTTGQKLVYDFLNISHIARVAIMRQVGCYDPADESLVEPEMWIRCFTRAREGKKLEEIRTAIDVELARLRNA